VFSQRSHHRPNSQACWPLAEPACSPFHEHQATQQDQTHPKSTPVSEEMSRLSSSMNVQPTNSLTQIKTKSYIGISSYRSSSRAVSRTGLASSAETNAPASSTRRASSRNQEVSRSPTTFAETGATPDMPSSSKGGDTLSGVSPQASTSQVSSAPGAASHLRRRL
jgi:hypothetical protein